MLTSTLLGLAAQASAAGGAGGTLATGTAGGSAPTSVAPAARKTPATPASAPPVRISRVSCVPAERCSTNPHQVSINGTLQLQGTGLRAGMVLVFPRSFGARISRASPGSRLRQSSLGLIATVPSSAHSGRIMVLISSTRHTGSFGPITIVHRALHPPAPKKPPTAASGGAGAVSGTAFDGQGMWIWYMSQSNGGSVPAIAARAHAAGVTTLFIKSSDGSRNYWSQFSPQLVAELHANGLKACAWQYVYGSSPAGEAELGARAVANGADCLVIDAEAEYEGHYAAAQTYINNLRAKIGPTFPLGLATFPYVSYHSAEPYSVFLGPGGAQYNAPQMYWHDIGVSVDTVYANTYIGNRIYNRPIFPLGQTYGGVSSADVLRFREEAVRYGATGLSFWDWQETPASGWSALAAPLAPLTSVTPNSEYPELRSGRKGDQVLWLQEHLASAIPSQEVTGNFGSQTTANLQAFQTSHGIAPTGVATPATWVALLALPAIAVNWTGGGPTG
ncbi:MAG TPA: peptidoglycan-binding domain-containing protein [Solirubrobacteraceae bacterium]|nr:peptidoglycan-binding domain-containing protein [Solirubrobacteraceae bacterium]